MNCADRFSPEYLAFVVDWSDGEQTEHFGFWSWTRLSRFVKDILQLKGSFDGLSFADVYVKENGHKRFVRRFEAIPQKKGCRQ